MPGQLHRRKVLKGLAALGLLPAPALSKPHATRSFRMGFAPTPPRPTVAAVLEGIEHWKSRAELAIIHEELPWARLLGGESPEAILKAEKTQLIAHLRRQKLGIHIMLDLTNGFARESEAPGLSAAGRSLAEPAVQRLAVDYALAVERMLRPEWLGLAAETNLIRQLAPGALYAAVKATAGATDRALAAAGAKSRRYISVQAEAGWGRLIGRGKWRGIEQDLVDFPFTRALGISSYPYFAWDDPAAIPADYYTRLRGRSGLPVIVTEGGWASTSAPPIKTSPEKQARYIARHAELLDSVKAIALFQLQFADIDIKSLPKPVPPTLPLFASLGMMDSDFRAKPALAAWDAVFARKWAG